MKKALVILTYCRFEYFELVLSSIKEQHIFEHPAHEKYDIYVFQDGLWEGESAANRDGHAKISKLLDRLPRSIGVLKQAQNLGIAFHFDFVERFVFVEKEYDFVVFCEDDLILAPGYMQVMDLMAEKFHDDPRVGMVSAHPGNSSIPLSEQESRRNKFTAMEHNWSFGLYREFWQKRQPLVDCYLNLIHDTAYRNRPHAAICKWLELIGFNGVASSQDYIKSCATISLGGCRISTFPNFGLPIGRSGLHFNPEIFKKMGLDCAVVYTQPLQSVGELDDHQYHEIYTKQLNQFGHKFSKMSCEEINKWQTRLLAGDFHPEKVLTHQHENFMQPKPVHPHLNIPSRPHMEAEGIELLEKRLQESEIYLEYGAGGSTVLAAGLQVQLIHSIESDSDFLGAVKEKVASVKSASTLITHHVDIGPTKEWGQPADPATANLWPNYCVAAWSKILSSNQQPDLILIDGRFRVACFIASILLAKPGTIILFDDYFDRPNYHVVEKHIKPTHKAGRMAEFIVDSSFDHAEALLDLLVHSTNPA